MLTRTLLSLALVLFLLPAVVSAETVAGLPLHVERLGEDVIRLWIGDHVSSTAVVAFATDEGIVVIDTTGLPAVDRELRRVIARELGRDDFTTLINTHEHGDHTGGNGVYADCTIVGHRLVEPAMQGNQGRTAEIRGWLTGRVDELRTQLGLLAAGSPEAARVNEDLVLQQLALAALDEHGTPPAPNVVFDDHLELDRGDLTFDLYYIGGMHSSSDIAVWVPERGLLMTGDTMADTWLTDTPGCLASFIARPNVEHDFPKLLKNWNLLLAKRAEIRRLLPGHWNGELSFDGFEARVRYVETLWDGVGAAAAAGSDLQTVLADHRLAERFPDLVDSPGCSQGNNSTTITELWTERTGQLSAAWTLFDLLDAGGPEADIRPVMAQLDAAAPSHYFLEVQMNALGYRLLQTEKTAEAVALFRCTTEVFPGSWNCWDSLAEALRAAGDRQEAIAMYEKSLELNPENTNGRAMLDELRAELAVN